MNLQVNPTVYQLSRPTRINIPKVFHFNNPKFVTKMQSNGLIKNFLHGVLWKIIFRLPYCLKTPFFRQKVTRFHDWVSNDFFIKKARLTSQLLVRF